MEFLKKRSIKSFLIFTLTMVIATIMTAGYSKAEISYQKVKSKTSMIYYTTQTIPLYKSIKGKDIIGFLTPATPVTLLSPLNISKKNRIKISVNGWSFKEAPSVVYYALGERIILLRLSQNAISNRIVLKEKKDSYGNTWEQVKVTGWIKGNSITNNISYVMDKARKIYEARCSACHALRPPKMFTANQWPSVLETMAKNAALNPEQKALVVKYMQMHAKGFVGRNVVK